MLIETILLIFSFGSTLDAYKILIVYPTPTHSHQAPVLALTEALIKKGHTLFVVNPIPLPALKNNYTHVDVSSAVPFFNDTLNGSSITPHEKKNIWNISEMWAKFAGIGTAQFRLEIFQKFYRRVKEEGISFDVVIAESTFLCSVCSISRLLSGNGRNIPIIGFSSFCREPIIEGYLGSVAHHSYLPSQLTEFTDRMSVWQKIRNWIINISYQGIWPWSVEQNTRAYLREIHGPDAETLAEGCWTNASLSLIASNFLYFYPRMLGPNVVEVGPLHLRPPPKLPKDLQDWLDGAKVGAIYFSLGSDVKSANLSKIALSNLMKVFRQLPSGYRVLWKWELDGPIPEQSDNILPQKWLPQQSVLAHPNVKVFITQGGMQSFQETVHYGVPTVGIPWVHDQIGIVTKMVDAGVGVRLRPSELSSYEQVKTAIEAVLFNDTYSKNMKKLSEISHDFTTGALEKAVFWVEHVAKYQDVSHLRPSTADSSLSRQLFKYFCLDIITVILLTSLASICVVVSLFRCFLSLCSLSKSKVKIS